MTLELDRRSLLAGGAASGLAAGFGTLSAFGQERTLDVIMPPSATRPEVLARFQQASGIRVRPAPYVSPVDTLSKLLAPGGRMDMMVTLVDLVRPNLAEAVNRRLLAPIDLAQVPSAAALSPMFASDVMRVGDRAYSVPVYWGYNPVLYNRAFIRDGDPLTDSYSLLLDDRYRGRVALRDDAHESIHMVALCMGHRRPAEMEPSDIREVTRFLISKKPNIRGLWSRFAEAVQMMASGEVHAMFGWLLMRKTLRRQGLDIASNHPREGLLWWVHGAYLPAGSQKLQDGHRWIDFLVSRDSGRELTEAAGVPSVSQAAKDSFTAEEQREHGYDVLDSGRPMVRLEQPRHLDRWLEAWSEFKAA